MRPAQARSPVLDPRRVAAALRATTVAQDAEPGLVRLTRLARDLLGASAALVSLVGGEKEELRAVVGLPEPYASGASVPLELAICVRTISSGDPVLVADLRADPVLSAHPLTTALGLHSCASVPLRVESFVVGGLCVLGDGSRTWDHDDLRLLSDLADAAATDLQLRGALHQLAIVREAERRLAAEQSALSRVATAVARGEAPDAVLAAAATEVAALLGAETVVVVRFEPDGAARLVASAGPVGVDAGLCDSVVEDLRVCGSAVVQREGSCACVATPVQAAGRVWGALAAAGPLDVGALPQLARTGDLLGVCVGNARAQARLVELTLTDPLTGAANRRAFGERVAQELERAQRLGTATTLALLDLDGFKAVNDEHGHLTGDLVLRELVARVGAELRAADVLARLGGDEFAVVLPVTDAAAAVLALERIGRAVRSATLAGVAISASLGAAIVEAGRCGVEDLYREADRALYRAKARGAGSVELERLD